jgi:hypothetical protein
LIACGVGVLLGRAVVERDWVGADAAGADVTETCGAPSGLPALQATIKSVAGSTNSAFTQFSIAACQFPEKKIVRV